MHFNCEDELKNIFLMNRSLLSFSLVLFLNSSICAQTFEWGVQAGGSSLDVVADSAGNVYSVGEFEGGGPFDITDLSDTLYSKGGFDYYVLKEDASGNILWVRGIG